VQLVCCHELRCAAGKWRLQETQRDTSAEVEEGIRNTTVAKEICVCVVCNNVCSQVHDTLMKTAAMKKEMVAGTVAKAAMRTGVLTATAAEARAAMVMSAAEVTILSEERGRMGRETEIASMRATTSVLTAVREADMAVVIVVL